MSSRATESTRGLLTPSLSSARYQDLMAHALPQEIEFMCDLVLLTSFTAEEAEIITDYPDVEKRLKSLVDRKLVTLISELPRVYQVTGLIRDVLRSTLASDPQRFRTIALRSATIAQEKNPLKALELYSLSGDTESAMKLAVTNLQHLIYQADMDLVTKWASKISQAIGGGPKGEKMIKAYGLYAVGKFDQVKATLRDLEAGMVEGAFHDVIPYESHLLRMRMDFIFGHFTKVIEDTESIPTPPSMERGRLIDINFSAIRPALITSFYLQDVASFLKFYDQVSPNFANASSELNHISINSFKSMRAFLLGHYLDAYEYALAACNVASELGVEGSYFPYESAYVLMDTSLEFGDDDLSQHYVDRYLPLALKSHQYPWIASFYAKAATIQLQKGDFNSALSHIRRGREAIGGPRFGSEISYIVDGHELVIRLALGEVERIQELLYRLPKTSQVEAFKVAMQIVRQPDEGPKLMPLIPEETPVEKFRKELILANVYVTDRKKALHHLREAIAIAVPNGYFRAFLNTSSELKSYIREYAEEHPTKYLENLAQAIREQQSSAQRGLMAEKGFLTKRELEILRRLSSGIPIMEIASTLHISKNTIKTHLKNLYRKLEVESRYEAVEKGKELALLAD